jgi:GntR family transcriptional regulator, transcriptional repressor for pyruvate dehydrogenase complex
LSIQAAPFARIGRRSVVDDVVDALTARILNGEMSPGDALPAEQDLASHLGVSRTVVREALSRLATARLVSMRHSGSKHVLDYRQSAGLELLSTLLIGPTGAVDPHIVASVMEMRSALAPDIARLAALRYTPDLGVKLRQVIAAMEAQRDDLAALQDLVSEFWSLLVDASRNIAYRLAYNSLRLSYEHSKQLFTHILAPETSDLTAYATLTAAVARGDAAAAESLARDLIGRGEAAVKSLLASLPKHSVDTTRVRPKEPA